MKVCLELSPKDIKIIWGALTSAYENANDAYEAVADDEVAKEAKEIESVLDRFDEIVERLAANGHLEDK